MVEGGAHFIALLRCPDDFNRTLTEADLSVRWSRVRASRLSKSPGYSSDTTEPPGSDKHPHAGALKPPLTAPNYSRDRDGGVQ
jgi:hypothetical protein